MPTKIMEEFENIIINHRKPISPLIRDYSLGIKPVENYPVSYIDTYRLELNLGYNYDLPSDVNEIEKERKKQEVLTDINYKLYGDILDPLVELLYKARYKREDEMAKDIEAILDIISLKERR